MARSESGRPGGVRWHCAECDSDFIVVCHHCGKPLCRFHRLFVDDDAFRHNAVEWPVRAAHCRRCRSTFHPRLAPLAGRRR